MNRYNLLKIPSLGFDEFEFKLGRSVRREESASSFENWWYLFKKAQLHGLILYSS